MRWPRFLDHCPVKISDGCRKLVGWLLQGESFSFNLLLGLVSDFCLRSAEACAGPVGASEVRSSDGLERWISGILIFTVKCSPSWSVDMSATCWMCGPLWQKGWWIGKSCVIFLRIFALHLKNFLRSMSWSLRVLCRIFALNHDPFI